MNHSMKLSLSTLAAIVAVAACSSATTPSTSNEPTDPAPTGTPTSSPKGDAGKPGSSGTSSGASSGTSGKPVDGDEACAQESTQQACAECCIKNHTKGYQTFVSALLGCACGGAGDGGAGPCATACKDTACSSPPSNPDASCNSCLQGILGASGACNQAVADACQPDADCVAEQTCLAPCQKKK